jgi:transcriptional regulator with XRE-family HTH domain
MYGGDPMKRRNDLYDALITEMDLAQDLVALRQAHGLTQMQLADRVGLSQPAIARLESNSVKNVELKSLVKIAAGLGARVKVTFEKGSSNQRGRRSRTSARRIRRPA